ncbi:MAG: response regulator [Proteobacteria bacterium]|nr:MAG: response regulator [Pseudomonadota bacterium]
MNPRIVLIEDDEDIRDSLSDLLQSEGYEVDTFPNGKEALDSLVAEPDPANRVILLDLMMPVMDGFQFLKARTKLGGPVCDVPTYVVSAIASKENLKGHQVSGYLNKPLDIDNLLQVIGVHGSPASAAMAAAGAPALVSSAS